MRQPFHPAREDLELATLFDALADPTRLEAVAYLAEVGEVNCSQFPDGVSKTNLAYHLRRLREAGITRTRAEGTFRYISLREEDLEARFPGLLEQVIASAQGKRRPRKAVAEFQPRAAVLKSSRARTRRPSVKRAGGR
jgi:DNA-binding transcriptional ArsR family regulator